MVIIEVEIGVEEVGVEGTVQKRRCSLVCQGGAGFTARRKEPGSGSARLITRDDFQLGSVFDMVVSVRLCLWLAEVVRGG